MGVPPGRRLLAARARTRPGFLGSAIDGVLQAREARLGVFVEEVLANFDRKVSLGDKAPRCFYVNWFRKTEDGKWLWPGFGENLRVLEWIIGRCKGTVEAVETPVGYLPTATALNTRDLDVDPATLKELLTVLPEAWRKELADIEEYLDAFGQRTPRDLKAELLAVRQQLG